MINNHQQRKIQKNTKRYTKRWYIKVITLETCLSKSKWLCSALMRKDFIMNFNLAVNFIIGNFISDKLFVDFWNSFLFIIKAKCPKIDTYSEKRQTDAFYKRFLCSTHVQTLYKVKLTHFSFSYTSHYKVSMYLSFYTALVQKQWANHHFVALKTMLFL